MMDPKHPDFHVGSLDRMAAGWEFPFKNVFGAADDVQPVVETARRAVSTGDPRMMRGASIWSVNAFRFSAPPPAVDCHPSYDGVIRPAVA